MLAFASTVDVVTFDHEHVPQDVLAALVAAGHRVHPGPAALAVAQDKLLMRERLSRARDARAGLGRGRLAPPTSTRSSPRTAGGRS